MEKEASAEVARGKSDLTHLMEMVNAYQQTCVIVAAIQVGLIERLADDSASVEQLASDLGLHAPSLRRLVRALQVLGLVEGGEDIHLTNRGKLLRKGAFGVRDWAVLVGEEYLLAWANLRHSLTTGEVAFDRAFGTSAWTHRQAHPELNEAFNRVTSSVQIRTTRGLLRAYEFSRHKCIVDVGGGYGHLLAGILAKYPDTEGILFDQPHVTEGATGALAKFRERTRIVPGSFFESVPTGGDAYLLKHCLHNWDDEACVTILRNCRRAMSDSCVLLVLENVLPERVEAAEALVMLDLHMMAVLGGRERTQQEYAALAADAGFHLSRSIPVRDGSIDILEFAIRE